jgi:molybdopterin-guanine dinucleotide biosynthesis protein A
MGVDKATIEFEGRPLIDHALAILRDTGLPVAIAGSRLDLANRAPVVEDIGASRGPLGGICGAMHAASLPWFVFIPVDLPLLPSALIAELLETAKDSGDAVVLPSAGGFVHTFPAVLNRVALPALQAELEAGRGGCFAAFQAAAAALGQEVNIFETERLVQSGQLKHPDGLPLEHWFLNINSTSDLQLAQRLRRGPGAL